jgi:hypothetical protein
MVWLEKVSCDNRAKLNMLILNYLRGGYEEGWC